MCEFHFLIWDALNYMRVGNEWAAHQCLGVVVRRSPNPYKAIMKMFREMPNQFSPKVISFVLTSASIFMHELEFAYEWHKMLTDDIKRDAFELFWKRPYTRNFKLASLLFRFAESSHLFMPYIESLINGRNMAEAVMICTVIKCSNGDKVLYALVQLLLSQYLRANIVYDYLDAVPDLREPLCRSLIEILSNRDENCQVVGVEDGVVRRIQKILNTLHNRYAIDTEYQLEQMIRAVNKFMIKKWEFKRYVKNKISMDNVADQVMLLKILIKCKQREMVLWWLDYYKCPLIDMPDVLVRRLDCLKLIGQQGLDSEILESRLYDGGLIRKHELIHVLGIRGAKIVWISCERDLRGMSEKLQAANVLAIDQRRAKPRDELALVVVAVQNSVFIVDMLGDFVRHNKALVFNEMARFLNNNGILKVAKDCDKLIVTLANEGVPVMASNECFLNFSFLWRHLMADAKLVRVLKLKTRCRYREKTMTVAVRTLLNKNLDVRGKGGDWGERPLTYPQLNYLVGTVRGIYEGLQVICARVEDVNMDLVELLQVQ